MAYSNDPIGNGVIASINRPGRNVTGLASSADDTTPKQFELLATVVPCPSSEILRQEAS
jgi:putative ABC transport system substrate-binding protein